MIKEKIKEIEQKYDMWSDDFNLEPQDVELLIKTSKRTHELESESYNAYLERLLDKKDFQNEHYREAILLAFYALGFVLDETEIDKIKERILQAKSILRNANVLEEIKNSHLRGIHSLFGTPRVSRSEKMVCRDCGNETEENKLFCSEACKKSYMEYLNNSIQRQEP